MTWIENLLTVSFFLRLVSYALLLAGFFFALLAGTILLFRRWRDTKAISWICSKLWLDLKIITVMSELPGVSRVASRTIPVLAAFALGYMTDEMLRYRSEREYPIKVIERIDDRHVIACKAERDGECVSPTFRFATCPHEAAPAFDEGKRYEVTFEVSSTMAGECNTFTGRHGNYKEIQ